MRLQLVRRVDRDLTDLTSNGPMGVHADVCHRRTAALETEQGARIFELSEGLLRLDTSRMSGPFEVVLENGDRREGYMTRFTINSGSGGDHHLVGNGL